MENSKAVRLISNVIYLIGVVVLFLLLGLVLFGANSFPNPNAMIPFSMRDIAFVGLAIGAIPMLLACMAVYKFNMIKMSAHRRRKFILIFAPGFLCGVCMLVVIGIFIIIMAQSML